jgi:hypothetical protein
MDFFLKINTSLPKCTHQYVRANSRLDRDVAVGVTDRDISGIIVNSHSRLFSSAFDQFSQLRGGVGR